MVTFLWISISDFISSLSLSSPPPLPIFIIHPSSIISFSSFYEMLLIYCFFWTGQQTQQNSGACHCFHRQVYLQTWPQEAFQGHAERNPIHKCKLHAKEHIASSSWQGFYACCQEGDKVSRNNSQNDAKLMEKELCEKKAWKKSFFTFCLFVLFQVTGVSITQGSDQLIVVHLSGGNDLVLCLYSHVNEERIGELVGILANLINR